MNDGGSLRELWYVNRRLEWRSLAGKMVSPTASRQR